MKNLFCASLLAMGCLAFTVGCDPAAKPKMEAHDAGTAGHDHPSHGPHDGDLIELGNEEYHAELVHTATDVTIYILDSAGKTAVPIAAKDVTINVKHEGKPESFALAAKPETSDAEGMSSRFTLSDKELVGHLEEEAAEPKLNVTIKDTPYVGVIAHDHDHDDHVD